MTALILSEQGKFYNEEAFEKALQEQKTRSRKDSAVAAGDWVVLSDSPSTEFVGYDVLEDTIELVRYREVEQKGKKLFHLVFDKTPFYPEGGGQVGDKGYIESNGQKLSIDNTFQREQSHCSRFKKLTEGARPSVYCSCSF